MYRVVYEPLSCGRNKNGESNGITSFVYRTVLLITNSYPAECMSTPRPTCSRASTPLSRRVDIVRGTCSPERGFVTSSARHAAPHEQQCIRVRTKRERLRATATGTARHGATPTHFVGCARNISHGTRLGDGTEGRSSWAGHGIADAFISHSKVRSDYLRGRHLQVSVGQCALGARAGHQGSLMHWQTTIRPAPWSVGRRATHASKSSSARRNQRQLRSTVGRGSIDWHTVATSSSALSSLADSPRAQC